MKRLILSVTRTNNLRTNTEKKKKKRNVYKLMIIEIDREGRGVKGGEEGGEREK